MSLINHRRRSARWHGASQKVGQLADPLFLDRIDLQIEVVPVPIKDLSEAAAGEASAKIRQRVIAARNVQANRYKDFPGVYCNAQMTERLMHQFCALDEPTSLKLQQAMERLHLSARAYNRILKVARTIADLEGRERIETSDITEAIGYRNLDRNNWAERGF